MTELSLAMYDRGPSQRAAGASTRRRLREARRYRATFTGPAYKTTPRPLISRTQVILWDLHNKYKEKAMKRQVVRSAMVAAVSSAVTIGIWTSITPASAGGSMPALVHPDSSQQVIQNVSLHNAYSAEVTVDPGDSVYGVAECSNGEKVIGGGYIISGTEGLAVASAVKSYPSKISANPNGYEVEVVNPTAASGPVTFTVKAVCIGISVTVVP